MYYIGIDLGTSAVKLLLMDETGSIANIVSREYPIASRIPVGASRTPPIGGRRSATASRAALDGLDASQVKGIGAGGQMHGWWCWTKMTRLSAPASFGTMAAPKGRSILKTVLSAKTS